MRANGGRYPDFIKNLNQLRHSPVSWSIAAIIVGIQLCVVLLGGPEMLRRWYEEFGLSRGGFLSGKLWQLVSYSLLHGGMTHVLLNGLFVLLIGSRIEHVAGRAAVGKVVLAGIILGGVFHLLLGAGLLVGMSGGCLALLMLLVTLSPGSRMYPLPMSGRNLGIGIMVAELILTLVDPTGGVIGFSRIGEWLAANGLGACFRMGHACHLGGGLAGWLCGRWLLRPRVNLAQLRHERNRREVN